MYVCMHVGLYNHAYEAAGPGVCARLAAHSAFHTGRGIVLVAPTMAWANRSQPLGAGECGACEDRGGMTVDKALGCCAQAQAVA